jgi:hypothetical protein
MSRVRPDACLQVVITADIEHDLAIEEKMVSADRFNLVCGCAFYKSQNDQ